MLFDFFGSLGTTNMEPPIFSTIFLAIRKLKSLFDYLGCPRSDKYGAFKCLPHLPRILFESRKVETKSLPFEG